MRRLAFILLLGAAAGGALAAEAAKKPATPAAAPAAPSAANTAPPAANTAPPAADLPTALFGMSWGDPVAPGMVRREVRMPPGVAMYGRDSDTLELAGVPLNAIHYVYEQGVLGGFSIPLAAGRKDSLVAALSKSWGPPRQAGEKSEWVEPTLRAVLGPGPEGVYILNVFPR
jgi:hypothetical protein